MDTLGLRLALVQRSEGQDARGLSAYGLCGKVAAPNRTFDFSRKAGEHVGGAILLPAGAPSWAADPARLWNAAEEVERRGDAQVARSALISIPRSIPADKRKEFSEHLIRPWIEDGMAAQLDVHCPLASDGGEQPHAHVLLTMRRFDGGGLAAKKEREWNRQFRDIATVRETMAQRANEWMQVHGLNSQLEHRSRADRGEQATAERDVSKAAWSAWKKDRNSDAAAPVRTLLAARAADRAAREAATEGDTARDRLRTRYSSAREACWQTYQTEKRQAAAAAAKARTQEEREQREALRGQQRADRTNLRRATKGSPLIRAFGQHRQGRRHAQEQHAARVAAYERRWTAPNEFPTFVDWTAQRAAQGDEAAQHLAREQERRTSRQPSGQAAAGDFLKAEARGAAAALKATEPGGSRDAGQLMEREGKHLAERRVQAAKAAEEAQQRAQEARSKVGVGGMLFGGQAAQAAALAVQEAQQATRLAEWAAGDYDSGMLAASEAAVRVAARNRTAHDRWDKDPATATLRRRHEQAQIAAAAVQAGDLATIEAAASGDLAGAVAAAREWRERQEREEKQRREQARQEQAAGMARERAEAAKNRPLTTRTGQQVIPKSSPPVRRFGR